MPFIPEVIEKTVQDSDYVVFKLDIDVPPVENAIANYMLDEWKYLHLLDEFVYEHHVENYVMTPVWGHFNLSIAKSYKMFLRFRERGVRAHSYV